MFLESKCQENALKETLYLPMLVFPEAESTDDTKKRVTGKRKAIQISDSDRKLVKEVFEDHKMKKNKFADTISDSRLEQLKKEQALTRMNIRKIIQPE